jgi:RNA polymerase sigma-70 factor (ECF subfamily)
MTDEELVTRITKGETELFSEIIERYGDKLSRYVQRIINQEREEVEDVVEDTLIAAYKNLNSYKSGYKFSSWIYRIGHNRAIDWMRKQKIKTENIEGMEEVIGNGDEEIEDGLIRAEDQEKVWRMLGKLPEREREILELYYFEDQNYEDIADILEISTNNVAVRLNRAKKKLKYIWEKYEKPEK